MACQLWSEKLGQYVDGELPPNEQHILREHMRGCADCCAARHRLVSASSPPRSPMLARLGVDRAITMVRPPYTVAVSRLADTLGRS